jgi:nitronate monooxygenase
VDTRFTQAVGCSLPVQQAAMGGVTTPALAGAVARAGGLGMLAGSGRSPEALRADLEVAATAAGGRAKIGVNFLMPFLDVAIVEFAAANAPLVECFYGDPDRAVVDRIHDAGALAAWQVGSRDEAVAAADAGADIVVAQGLEAGGHVRGTTPLLELVASVRDSVEVPIVAAGGIGSAAALAAALDAGADAGRVGTVLLVADEADVHPDYVAALITASASDTTLTEAFSMGWPNAPHRVLTSSIEASDADPSTRSPMPPMRAFQGDVASAALYAGTSVGDVERVRPAAEIIRSIAGTAD